MTWRWKDVFSDIASNKEAACPAHKSVTMTYGSPDVYLSLQLLTVTVQEPAS